MINYAERFAYNLRILRKQHNLTQESLADILGYSKKTISKWECGDCIPDIETLFKLSETLHTNVESLFKGSEKYLLGIDGGGTKTELVLADANGNTIRRIVADTCNPMDVGIEAARNTLKGAIYEICRDIPFSSIVMYAGIAGGTSTDMHGRFKKFFEGFNFHSFLNDSDNKLIISAGLDEREGITLIMGTGICAFTQINGEQYKTAGWGYFIDNGGSAYNIGRDALNVYFTALDKSGEATLITEEVEKVFPDDYSALMGYIYSGGKKNIAGFASTVFRAFDRGDKVAEQILRRNMADAAKVIETAAREFTSGIVDVVIAGGLTNEPELIPMLKEALAVPGKFNIKNLEEKPVNGAIKLARKLLEKEMEKNA